MNKRFLVLASLALMSSTLWAQKIDRSKGDPELSEIFEPEVPVVTPGKTASDAPSDAIILFNGKDASAWQNRKGEAAAWTVADGAMTVKPGAGEIHTRESFGDCQLHIEWRTPAEVKGNGQGRGNSGIFLMGRYELQVLDNYNNKTYSNGQAGSIYKQLVPSVNVCRPPGEWQSYDIIFTAPVFYDNGLLKSQARITVIQNGVLVLNNMAIWGGTEYIGMPVYERHASKLPIMLQDHGNPVSYRNIWIRPL
jgi:hypothetical protein